jgi:hypothetical protein
MKGFFCILEIHIKGSYDMRIRLFFTSILILFHLFGSAQIRIDTTRYFDSYGYGSVKLLSDKPMLKISVFISDENSDWKPSEKKRLLRLERKALKWIEKQARGYGLEELDITAKDYFTGDKDFEIKTYPKSTGWTINQDSIELGNDTVLKQIWETIRDGKMSNNLSMEELENYTGGYFVIMYYKRYGTAKASPLHSHNPPSDMPEFIYVSHRDINGLKTRKQTIAHEILHLFGAWDFYHTSITLDKTTSDKIATLYPSSIMLTGSKSFASLTIDPITAWRIGLSEAFEPWYLEIVPKYYHKSSYRVTP